MKEKQIAPYNFSSEIMRIIAGAVKGDLIKVKRYSEFMAQKAEDAGDDFFARQIRKCLKGGGAEVHTKEKFVYKPNATSGASFYA